VIIHLTTLRGVAIVEVERHVDGRGSFARTFDVAVFAANGLDPSVAQRSTSFNPRCGTLRGLHYQRDPHGEGKLIRCTRGRIFDVAVDLRRDSSTYRQWVSIELSADGIHSVFIPSGCAHGFQTLEDCCEVDYQMTTEYVPDAATGVRWDDPAFGISWPEPLNGERTISERDRGFLDHPA
jgi:dTDP-4-dehydrorhamnose 3,5-epimerase